MISMRAMAQSLFFQSTDDDGLDSKELDVEKTIRKTIKTLYFIHLKKSRRQCKKSARKMTIKTSQRYPEGKRIWNKNSTVSSVKRHKARLLDILKEVIPMNQKLLKP